MLQYVGLRWVDGVRDIRFLMTNHKKLNFDMHYKSVTKLTYFFTHNAVKVGNSMKRKALLLACQMCTARRNNGFQCVQENRH